MWAGYVAGMGRGEGHIRLQWGKRALLRHRRWWENDIKMDLKEVKRKRMGWIEVPEWWE